MRKTARAEWLSRFDMENLLSSILRNGALISIGLISASVLLRWFEKDQGVSLGRSIQAVSVPALLSADFPRVASRGTYPSTLLMHLGLSMLLLTPYLRVVASTMYFAFVERNWKYVLFSSLVLILLTITLLTNLV